MWKCGPRNHSPSVKKNELKPWQNKEGCIPAKGNAEFACAMENVLDVYKRPYDETYPLLCMDESSKQHLKETRQPIPAKPGSIEKYDTEYERNGVSNVFMFFEPLGACRTYQRLKPVSCKIIAQTSKLTPTRCNEPLYPI